MTPVEFLVELTRDGFTLTPEGEGIRVKPASSLTPDRKLAIQERKGDLLTILRRPRWDPTPEEERKICRMIELDQRLPAGSVRLYTPEEFREWFKTP